MLIITHKRSIPVIFFLDWNSLELFWAEMWTPHPLLGHIMTLHSAFGSTWITHFLCLGTLWCCLFPALSGAKEYDNTVFGGA